jgi:hypothetical protein
VIGSISQEAMPQFTMTTASASLAHMDCTIKPCDFAVSSEVGVGSEVDVTFLLGDRVLEKHRMKVDYVERDRKKYERADDHSAASAQCDFAPGR